MSKSVTNDSEPQKRALKDEVEELRSPRSSDESRDSRTEVGTEREEKTQTQSIYDLLRKDGPLTRRQIQERMRKLRSKTSLGDEIQREKKKGRISDDVVIPENGRIVRLHYINKSQLYRDPRATELWVHFFERDEHIQGLVREVVKRLGKRAEIRNDRPIRWTFTLEEVASIVGMPLADIERELRAELRRLDYRSSDGRTYNYHMGPDDIEDPAYLP